MLQSSVFGSFYYSHFILHSLLLLLPISISHKNSQSSHQRLLIRVLGLGLGLVLDMEIIETAKFVLQILLIVTKP